MDYFSWNEKKISDFSTSAVADMYGAGYVFTRKGKGVMQQTRSVRIDLSRFELSSENRRIVKKTDDIAVSEDVLPYGAYDFSIGKLAKDFYDTKFGHGIMSAQKIKEMMTSPMQSNFNALFVYTTADQPRPIGYCISYKSELIQHYSYPFYDRAAAPKDMGLGMMIRAIELSKSRGQRYFYLGSLQRPSDTYKLQFAGLEWFDGGEWQTDIEAVKHILVAPPVL